MKKLIVLLLACFVSLQANAQQLFLEVFSGYNRTNYKFDIDTDDKGYVPIGVRLAGGLEHLQLGAEYHTDITHPEYSVEDELGNEFAKTSFVNTYYGGLLRINASSLPAYRFGLIFKLGAGMYEVKHETKAIDDNRTLGVVEYDPTFGFNGGIGISAPIYTLLHWEIGYMYHHVKYDAAAPLVSYTGSYHSFQIGLSLNLVFGTTAESCRRMLKDDRSSRGWK